jgi:hypothetical protein
MAGEVAALQAAAQAFNQIHQLPDLPESALSAAQEGESSCNEAVAAVHNAIQNAMDQFNVIGETVGAEAAHEIAAQAQGQLRASLPS